MGRLLDGGGAGWVKAQLVGAGVLGAGAGAFVIAAALSVGEPRVHLFVLAALASAALALLLMYGLVVVATEERSAPPDA